MNHLPIKLYRTADRVTVAAPTPGLLAQDFAIQITPDNRLILRGAMRGLTADVQVFDRLVAQAGSGKSRPRLVEEHRELLIDEWSVGSFHRELDLPTPVDGTLATATYGNGVLVVTLPVAKRVRPDRVSLQPVGISRGEHVGSAGHPIQRRSTAEHLRAVHHAR
jgi:HSP20 family protein